MFQAQCMTHLVQYHLKTALPFLQCSLGAVIAQGIFVQFGVQGAVQVNLARARTGITGKCACLLGRQVIENKAQVGRFVTGDFLKT